MAGSLTAMVEGRREVQAEAILKTAVLIDIRRRPASQIRGSKRMWIVGAVLVNSAGVGPLS
jgi:hypothetical protein